VQAAAQDVAQKARPPFVVDGCAPPRWPVGQLSSKRETAAGLLYGGPQLTIEARKG